MTGAVHDAVARAQARPAAPAVPVPARRWRRYGRAVLMAATVATVVRAFLAFGVAPVRGQFTGAFEDFAFYLGGARAAASGGDLYATFARHAGDAVPSGFIYPPVVAWLCRPLTWFDHHTAAVLWLWVLVGSTVAGSLIVARTLLPATWPRTQLALLGALLYAPAADNVWRGQINPVIFLLLALALWAWVRGHELRCGALIGTAAAIKVAPILLVLILLRRRWWRGSALAAGVATAAQLVGLLVVGRAATTGFVQTVLPALERDHGWVLNQSWGAVLSRLADHSVFVLQPGAAGVRIATLALSLATLATVVWVVSPRRRPDTLRGAEFGAAAIAMLLCSAIAWYEQYISLLIPLAAAAALAAAAPRLRRVLAAGVAVALVVTGAVAPLLIEVTSRQRLVDASHTAAWWPLLQVASLPALSAAALLAVLVHAGRRAAVA